MIINVHQPSSMEAELVKAPSHAAVSCKPIRWHAGQTVLSTFVVSSCTDDGAILDQGILTVNQRTGKLSFKKLKSGGIPLDADGGKSKKSAPSDDISEGQK